MNRPEFTPKPISASGVARALSKAERYRLLNEPREAESICRDVLAIEPENQDALMALALAITDQFESQGVDRAPDAFDVVQRLASEYERVYYRGVITERQAKTLLGKHLVGHRVYDLLITAMECFDEAQRLSPPGNDDAILRWNTCARLIQSDERIAPREERFAGHTFHDEDMPMR